MKALLIGLLMTVQPVDGGWWEQWEPKTSLPTQAVETLNSQAVVLIPPIQIEADPIQRWDPLVRRYQWDTPLMLEVMRCESSGIPTAENRHSTATGLFQIMQSIWYPQGPRSDLHNPELNTQIAFQVWQIQGMSAWNASRHCWQ